MGVKTLWQKSRVSPTAPRLLGKYLPGIVVCRSLYLLFRLGVSDCQRVRSAPDFNLSLFLAVRLRLQVQRLRFRTRTLTNKEGLLLHPSVLRTYVDVGRAMTSSDLRVVLLVSPEIPLGYSFPVVEGKESPATRKQGRRSQAPPTGDTSSNSFRVRFPSRAVLRSSRKVRTESRPSRVSHRGVGCRCRGRPLQSTRLRVWDRSSCL